MADVADTFLHDTQVPDLFFTDYVPNLGHFALQLYLLAFFYQDENHEVAGDTLIALLGISPEDYKAAICELAAKELVTTENDFARLTLVDLKKKTLHKLYRPLTSSPMEEIVERTDRDAERQSLLNSVNDTYFHGMMGPVWYQTIDSWFDEYHLDAHVIYQMILDGSRANKLNGPNYLNRVAQDYAKHGVKNFEDLAIYKENNKKTRRVAAQVGKKLNKKMSEYDYHIVERWVVEYGYDMPMIEIALRRAVRLAEPNMNYFDAILKSWFEAGIKKPEEAENIEANQQKQARNRSTNLKNRRNMPGESGEFATGREYDDEYLAQFYHLASSEEEDKE